MGWLPAEFPPGCDVILSCSTPSSSNNGSCAAASLIKGIELRWNLQQNSLRAFSLEQLDVPARLGLVNAFLEPAILEEVEPGCSVTDLAHFEPSDLPLVLSLRCKFVQWLRSTVSPRPSLSSALQVIVFQARACCSMLYRHRTHQPSLEQPIHPSIHPSIHP